MNIRRVALSLITSCFLAMFYGVSVFIGSPSVAFVILAAVVLTLPMVHVLRTGDSTTEPVVELNAFNNKG